jgi:hypothetical protein
MLDRLSRLFAKPIMYGVVAAVFVFVNVIGYKFFGGLNFVQGWGGGIAASIATFYLIFKLQGYWAWMIVNASLWTYLFFHTGIPMLAWLQISIAIFSIYGIVQWALVKYRIGFTPKVSSDVFGAALASVFFIFSVVVYLHMPGYAFTGWWYVEFFSVATSVMAIVLDAFKYKLNWLAWTASNVFSFFLFLHLYLYDATYAGPFWTIFIYQTLNCIGFYYWYKQEKVLAKDGRVVFVGGVAPEGVI